MDVSEHIALTLPAAAVVGLASGRWNCALAFAVGGILIDADHLPDYWREKGFKNSWSLPHLNAHFGQRQARQLVLPLHAWEWNALLWIVWATLGLPLWVAALAAGMLAHLALDQRFNLLQPWAYFFFGRWRVGFQADPLYPDPRP